MIEKIGGYHYPAHNRQSVFDSEELSALELAAKNADKMNEVIGYANSLDSDIKSREKSDDITEKRKLSSVGDFTGSLAGRTIISVLSDIADALSLSNTIIGMVNDRESIGTIYDGGTFIDELPPVVTIEGGMF